ncbi:hypothetical protein ACFL4T_09645 [candidate division KSB1 bacterium]
MKKGILFAFIILFFFGCSKRIELKALLIDYNLSPPIVNSAIGRIFKENGVNIEYRQYYPSLVKSDFSTYDVIVLLSGKTPPLSSAQMSSSSVEYLKDYVKKGGLLFLGTEYSDPLGEGNHERSLFNKLLKDLNIDIQIYDDKIQDIKNGYPSPFLYKSYFLVPDIPFFNEFNSKEIPLDNTPSLWTGNNSMVMLTSSLSTIRLVNSVYANHKVDDFSEYQSRLPVVAVGKAGEGFILVASRYLYNSIGYSNEITSKPLLKPEKLELTEKYLRKLTKFFISLKSKDLYQNGNCTSKAEFEDGKKYSVEINNEEMRDEIPDSVKIHTYNTDEPLWGDYDRISEMQFDNPDDINVLIKSRNFRVGKDIIRKSEEHVKNMISSADQIGLNTIWTIINPYSVLKPNTNAELIEENRKSWELISEESMEKNLNWIAGMRILDAFLFVDRTVGFQNQKIKYESPVSSKLWTENVKKPLLYFVNYMADSKSLKGVLLDISLNMRGYFSYPHCYGLGDESYMSFLRETNGKIPRELWSGTYVNRNKNKYLWLKNSGMLEKYFEVLEGIVEKHAASIKAEIEKVRPDLYFAVFSPTLPSTWFERGVVKGFGSTTKPVLYFTLENITKPYIDKLINDGIFIIPISSLMLGMTNDFNKVFENSNKYSYGYWLNRFGWLFDSTEYANIETPLIRNLGNALDLIGQANLK